MAIWGGRSQKKRNQKRSQLLFKVTFDVDKKEAKHLYCKLGL